MCVGCPGAGTSCKTDPVLFNSDADYRNSQIHSRAPAADKTTCSNNSRKAILTICHARLRVKVCIYLLAYWMMRRLLWVHVFDEVYVCVSLSVLEFSCEDLVCLHDVSSLIHAATLPLTRRMTLGGVWRQVASITRPKSRADVMH